MVEGADRHPQSRAFTPSCRDDNRASFVPERATLRRVRSWGSRRELFSLSLSVNPLKRATNDVPISAADLALPRAPPNRGKEERGGRGMRCSVRSSSRSTRNEALSRLVRRIRVHCEPK